MFRIACITVLKTRDQFCELEIETLESTHEQIIEPQKILSPRLLLLLHTVTEKSMQVLLNFSVNFCTSMARYLSVA